MICSKFIQRQLAANAAHAAINHYVGDEADSPADNSLEQSENMPEERHRRFWVRFFLKVMNDLLNCLKGALAHAAGSVARSFLGDQDNAPDVATAAENLHNTYAAMSEKRQRRFWVRFFIGHPTTGKTVCLKCI